MTNKKLIYSIIKRGRGDHKKTPGLWKRSPYLQQCVYNNITANVRFGKFSDYLGKNSYNFVLKLKRLDERVDEIHILGLWS